MKLGRTDEYFPGSKMYFSMSLKKNRMNYKVTTGGDMAISLSTEKDQTC